MVPDTGVKTIQAKIARQMGITCLKLKLGEGIALE
jgi:hypothetical protein